MRHNFILVFYLVAIVQRLLFFFSLSMNKKQILQWLLAVALLNAPHTATYVVCYVAVHV